MIAARTIDDVRRAVTAGGRVRALGTRHSFNDLADNGDTLVTVTGIAPEPVLDETARTVTVGAGISYGALAGWLQQRGWALHNLGSLPHISIAGATATGTHGSGSRNQILSAAIAGLEYVDADGELRRAGRADPDFAGMAVGLGAFGIVVRVTLDVQPSYLVRQDVYAGLRLGPGAGRPGRRHVRRLQRQPVHRLERARRSRRRGSSVGSTGRSRTALRRRSSSARPATRARRGWSTPRSTTSRSSARRGPWSERLPHFRIDSPPSNGDEIQSEYFVDRASGAAALDAVRRLSPLITPLLLVSEIRATAAGPAVAERVLRPGHAGDPLHLAQPPRPGQRGADRGRGGAGAVRRPPALGEGLAHPGGPARTALPPAGRRPGAVRAARPPGTVQQRAA